MSLLEIPDLENDTPEARKCRLLWRPGDQIQGPVVGPQSHSLASLRNEPISANYLVGAQQDRFRDGDTERGRGFQVDRQLVPGELLDWQISRLGSFQ